MELWLNGNVVFLNWDNLHDLRCKVNILVEKESCISDERLIVCHGYPGIKKPVKNGYSR